MIEPRLSTVAVDGGGMTVAEWGDPAAPPVLAIHGITASHLAWTRVAEALPDRRVVAPDLRGRGRSAGLPGPFGMARHAADLVRLLDGLGLDRVPLVGHSMGAFVATATAALAPERVTGAALVDGGIPFPSPADGDVEGAVRASLGPALARLTMTFPDRDAYRAFWAQTPALGALVDDEAVRAYIDYDLVGDPPHPATAPAAAAQDSLEFYGDIPARALDTARVPLELLWAPRGLQDETPGLYTEERLADAVSRWPRLRTRFVDDVNHYTIVMTPRGAAAVAEAVGRAE